MKWLIYLILPLFLSAQSPFESIVIPPRSASVFNTKTDIKPSSDKKIKCRYICDKKIYNLQVITDAINFYINSKYSLRLFFPLF